MPEEFTFAEESTGPEWVTTLMFNTLPFEAKLVCHDWENF